MKYLDLTFQNPEDNLACDEALLDRAEETPGQEVLRFWESPDYFVVLGYSNRTQSEISSEECKARKIHVLRRSSGGGTVLQGPGCLNYSLILQIKDSGPSQTLVKTNRWIMENHREALESELGRPVQVRGTTDLAVGDLKFSGNAQRRKRLSLLFHGTFLYNFDLPKMREFLKHPPREPDYRNQRTHQDFLTNISLSPERIKTALKKRWGAAHPLPAGEVPRSKMADLVGSRYSQEAWNFKF